MKKIYYEKQGRRYVPVREYDSDFMDGFPKGAHLVMCYPGGISYKYNIDPNYAALIAAGRVAKDAMVDAVVKAAEIRRNSQDNKPLTDEQKAAWEHLVEVLGDDARRLEWASANDVADAGLQAMQREAERLMTHPAVRDAFDQFQTVVKLVCDGETKSQ